MAETTNYLITQIVEGQGQQSATVNTALDIIDRGLGGYISIALSGSSDLTLTALQWQNKIFNFTGTLTVNVAIIVPNTTRHFVVINNTVGSFTFTVKTAAGLGAAIIRLHSATLVGDGTNISHLTTSGMYIPTFTNVANVSSSTPISWNFMCVGKVVTVSGQIDIDPTAAATLTQLGMSLPIPSNFSGATHCAGVAMGIISGGAAAAILGDATNDRAELRWYPVSDVAQTLYFTFTYRII